MRLKKELSLAMVIFTLIFGVRVASAARLKDFFQLCRQGSIEEIRAAIEAGADIHAKKHNGESVLYSALVNQNLDVVSLLIEKGADINSRDKIGGTVLMAAPLLLPYPLDAMRILIEKGADVNHQNKRGSTALMLAAYGDMGAEGNDRLSAIKILLDRGADINLQDNGGWTALMFSVVSMSPEPEKVKAISLLLDSGANPNLADKTGMTALDMMISLGERHKSVEILNKLKAVTYAQHK